MHPTSMDNMAKFVETHLGSRRGQPLKVLDIGSQDVNGSYRQLFVDPSWAYTGVDMEPGNGVDVVLQDVYAWRELAPNGFDVVISGQTLEHVEYPWLTMLEIARVMKPGGLCCIIAPSSGFEHRYPVDCWRFYSDGMRALARYAAIEVLEAYTFDAPTDSTGGTNTWKDSVLIGRKPEEHPLRARLSLSIRRAVSRWVLPPSIGT